MTRHLCLALTALLLGTGMAEATDHPPGYVLQETIIVPVDGRVVMSASTLAASVSYEVRAAGPFAVGGPGDGQGDAEYANFSHPPGSLPDACGAGGAGEDLGIGIHDTVNDAKTFPGRGDYSATHQDAIDARPPTIHRVTLHPDTGVLTVTGTGLGPDLQVTVDGQPVPQLPGATDTQIEVLASVTVVTQPGTYRLTVVDPMRRVGDGFVVVSPTGRVQVASEASPARVPADRSPVAGEAAASRSVVGPADTTASRAVTAASPQAVIEDSVSPFRTAIGYRALFSNTASGLFNTASGFQALYSNTTGSYNTASGAFALLNNTTGSRNTASGHQALYFNTTGANNTASGVQALAFNSTGFDNTASGAEALNFNTTGFSNTASGYQALFANTTGLGNTASGVQALSANTLGVQNTASGYRALFSNTGGFNNTASGLNSLYFNTTGANNTASGYQALAFNTTGFNNTASGVQALYLNTTGSQNVAVGDNAGANATTGSYNIFLGAAVTGTAADTNMIRIGLPHSAGVGQNQTFIAGIWGTQLTGTAAQVMIDANGQLGIGTPVAILNSGAATTMAPAGVEQRFQEQQAINAAEQATIAEMQALVADLRARLARLEASAPRRR